MTSALRDVLGDEFASSAGMAGYHADAASEERAVTTGERRLRMAIVQASPDDAEFPHPEPMCHKPASVCGLWAVARECPHTERADAELASAAASALQRLHNQADPNLNALYEDALATLTAIDAELADPRAREACIRWLWKDAARRWEDLYRDAVRPEPFDT